MDFVPQYVDGIARGFFPRGGAGEGGAVASARGGAAAGSGASSGEAESGGGRGEGGGEGRGGWDVLKREAEISGFEIHNDGIPRCGCGSKFKS